MRTVRLLTWAIISAVVMTLFLNSISVIHAGAGEDRPKAVMVIVNRVNFEDITDPRYKNISRMISLGSLGVMTINTGGDYSDTDSYMTIGGGDRLTGSSLAGECYNRDEILVDGSRAWEAYFRNTGENSGDSEVLNIAVASAIKANDKKYRASTPGRLGTVLHEFGLTTAVIGNSDFVQYGPPNRLAANIVMDDLGRVDYGNVGRDLLKGDPKSPFGWKTDYERLETELKRVWDKADFIVIETGDTLRANSSSGSQFKQMVDYHRSMALRDADRFIGRLLDRVDNRIMIMLVSPLPTGLAFRDGTRLSPLVVAGGAVEPGTVLVSPTTRQSGLVANYDLTATVLSHLQIKKPAGIVGLPVQGVYGTGRDSGDQIGTVADVYSSLTADWRQRTGVLYYFTRYHWIVYGLVFLMIIFSYKKQNRCNVKLARFFMTGILLYPLAVFLVPLTGSLNRWLSIFLSLIILLILTVFFTKIKSDLKLFAAVSLVNVAPYVADVLTGARLMKKAALGYDLVVGGRFYGIGNEYMGIIIGSAILGAAVLFQMFPRAGKLPWLLSGSVFACLIIFFAAPWAGTNAGGALAAVSGFAVSMYCFTGRKATFRSALILAAILAGGFGVLVAVNYFFLSGSSSHIGRAVSSLLQGDLAVIWYTIQRKWVANIHLLKNSPFSVLLIMQVLIWAGLVLRNRVVIKEIFKDYPYFKAGITGMLSGALAAFIFNDSGVIASALMLNYLVVPVIIIAVSGYMTGGNNNSPANGGQ